MITNIEFELLFNALFFKSDNTLLVNGLDVGELEPLFLPAMGDTPARIIYAHGFLSSALHEVAHWCFAGAERRKLVDYGYWYSGDERDQKEQHLFEQVELVPQAYESLLSESCGLQFKVSLDNFNPAVALDREQFTQKVLETAQYKLKYGASPRLQRLLKALVMHESSDNR
jgi:elongation factor P hydroxylase